MKPEDGEKQVVLANVLIDIRHGLKELMGINYNEGCVIAAVGMCAQADKPANIATIARILDIPHSTATRLLDKMVDENWIKRIETDHSTCYTRTDDINKSRAGSAFTRRMEKSVKLAAARLMTLEAGNHHQNGET